MAREDRGWKMEDGGWRRNVSLSILYLPSSILHLDGSCRLAEAVGYGTLAIHQDHPAPDPGEDRLRRRMVYRDRGYQSRGARPSTGDPQAADSHAQRPPTRRRATGRENAPAGQGRHEQDGLHRLSHGV